MKPKNKVKIENKIFNRQFLQSNSLKKVRTFFSIFFYTLKMNLREIVRAVIICNKTNIVTVKKFAKRILGV